MNILLTGANGYIGKRLLINLIAENHHVFCIVRDKLRFSKELAEEKNVSLIQLDFNDISNCEIPENIDVAYYLIHSMSSDKDYSKLEANCAKNFKSLLSGTQVKQVIYLSGITNDSNLSKHLNSRKNVEGLLKSKNYSLTTLKAGIIIGSGSASFEIIRDLVEKLPVMIAPKWLNTRCQPIAIRDVLSILLKAKGKKTLYNKSLDIGGPDILTYKEMLLEFANIRNLKRRIFIVPVMTPRLSSYWLYFVTSTSYYLAIALVNSMKIEVVCSKDQLDINKELNIHPVSYEKALKLAFEKIDHNLVISSWKDSYSSSKLVSKQIRKDFVVPSFGCYKDVKFREIDCINTTKEKLWNIGGKNGWYYGNKLWKIRGWFDKLIGGVGLRRGRTNQDKIEIGDSLDFWRVLYADESRERLVLYAEMKLPGEAWLEFKIKNKKLIQTATFRPKGLLGRLYWKSVIPFHYFIFNGMINNLSKNS